MNDFDTKLKANVDSFKLGWVSCVQTLAEMLETNEESPMPKKDLEDMKKFLYLMGDCQAKMYELMGRLTITDED